MTAYTLVTGGALIALLSMLLHTSEDPTVLGRYSPRIAALIVGLFLCFLIVSITPLIAAKQIEHWLTRGIRLLEVSPFGLEIFGGSMLLLGVSLIILALFAWGISIRAMCIIVGTLLILAGILLTLGRIASPLAFQQMAKRLGLMSFGLMLGLIITELGLQLMYLDTRIYSTQPASLKIESHPDPEILPGISGSAMFTTQANGLRGEPYDAENYNILAIGGSTTEQVYLDDSETWTSIVQETVGQTPSGQQVWVGNSGRAAHLSAHHAYVLRYLAPQYRLDAVIVLLGANDLSAYLMPPEAVIPNPADPSQQGDLMYFTFWSTPDNVAQQENELYVVRIARNLLGQIIADPKPSSVIQDPLAHWVVERRNWLHHEQTVVPLPDLESGLDQYERNLRIMIREARDQNVRLIFVTQPVMWRDDLPPEVDALLWAGYVGEAKGYFDPADLRSAMDAFNERLLEVCEAERIECIDIAALMSGNPDYFYDDMHFNEAGAREAGSLISGYLSQHPPFFTGK